MTFTSRKGVLPYLFVWGLVWVLISISAFDFMSSQFNPKSIWVHLLNIMVILLLFWLFYGTSYTLNKDFLSYKSGPFRGKIEITSIKEIVRDKTSWIGFKPATATKGLIIKYGKFYDELYISPSSNQKFINELLKINPSITITQA